MALRYMNLVTKILFTTIILASSVLIFVTMALTSKLRTAVDIISSQVIISSVIITTVSWSYKTYLRWRVGSRQSTVVCLFITTLGLAGYIVVLASYLSVAVMQLVIVKRGMHEFGKLFTRRIASMASVGMWIVSIAASGVAVAGRYGNIHAYIYDPVSQTCYSHVLDSTSSNLLLSLGTAIWTLLSVAATSMCYTITIRALRSQLPPEKLKSLAAKRTYGIEKLSAKTRRRLVASVKRIIALMLLYMVVLLPAGIISGLSAVSRTSLRYTCQQVAYTLSLVGMTAHFLVYILSYCPRCKACYMLLIGRYKDIEYNV